MNHPRTIKLRYWFYGGFALVFVAMLFLYSIHARHPSGQFLVHQSLGRFYVETMPKLFVATALGPATDNLNNLPMVLLEHLILSLVGGLIMLAIGMCWNWMATDSK
jgi:hypothetical protein